jgi:hypothetical protein
MMMTLRLPSGSIRPVYRWARSPLLAVWLLPSRFRRRGRLANRQRAPVLALPAVGYGAFLRRTHVQLVLSTRGVMKRAWLPRRSACCGSGMGDSRGVQTA